MENRRRWLLDASSDGKVLLLQTAQGLVVTDEQGRIVGPIRAVPPDAAVSPDGRFLVTRAVGLLQVEDLHTSAPPRTLEGSAWDFRISPHSSRIAATVGEGTVRAWDLVSGRSEAVVRHVGGHSGTRVVGFSFDSRSLDTHCGDAVSVWDLEGLGPTPAVEGDPVRCVEDWTGLTLPASDAAPLPRPMRAAKGPR